MAARVIWGWLAVALTGLMLAGCGEKPLVDEQGRVEVPIKGETFRLELAADDSKRVPGLGGRESIEADGGMLFAFREPAVMSFLMRDCLVAIDIAYLDSRGRVLKMYTMPAEPPRGEGEGEPGWLATDPDLTPAQRAQAAVYEARLPKYTSRYDAQFVIELRKGTLERLRVREGDQIALDWEALKRLAK
ncbi:MAG: DUF192 domain-containing protein [Planctomycetota bacterium]